MAACSLCYHEDEKACSKVDSHILASRESDTWLDKFLLSKHSSDT